MTLTGLAMKILQQNNIEIVSSQDLWLKILKSFQDLWLKGAKHIARYEWSF